MQVTSFTCKTIISITNDQLENLKGTNLQRTSKNFCFVTARPLCSTACTTHYPVKTEVQSESSSSKQTRIEKVK